MNFFSTKKKVACSPQAARNVQLHHVGCLPVPPNRMCWAHQRQPQSSRLGTLPGELTFQTSIFMCLSPISPLIIEHHVGWIVQLKPSVAQPTSAWRGVCSQHSWHIPYTMRPASQGGHSTQQNTLSIQDVVAPRLSTRSTPSAHQKQSLRY